MKDVLDTSLSTRRAEPAPDNTPPSDADMQPLSPDDLRQTLADALAGTRSRRVLLIHPDYSRNDYCPLLVPLLYDRLRAGGLERLDTLNAGGTHRAMRADELHA